MLYILTSVWVLRTQNAGEICNFDVIAIFLQFLHLFSSKKMQKEAEMGKKRLQQNAGSHPNAGLAPCKSKTAKTSKLHISTSVLGVKPPNAGRNIQQIL